MSRGEIESLLRRCAAGGDEAAWRQFLEMFGAALSAGVRKVARQAGLPGDPANREELLQEVYCRLLENEGRILLECRGESAPAVAAYLRRVAASAAVDRLRLLTAIKRGRHLQVRLRDVDRSRWRDSFIAESPGPEARLLARERRPSPAAAGWSAGAARGGTCRSSFWPTAGVSAAARSRGGWAAG